MGKSRFYLQAVYAISFSRIGKAFNAVKVKGYSFESVFTVLVTMVLKEETTLSSLTCSIWQKSIQAKKDVFYRLKNNPLICWRQILSVFDLRYKRISKKSSGFNEREKYLVFDDTDSPKTGKRIELIGCNWNHVFNVSILGFKMRVMDYWDGTCFTPP